MLTADDLKKIQEVVEKVIDKRVEETETKIEHRFSSVDKRFNAVGKRFERVDQRFDGIDQRFDTVDNRFEGIEIQLANMARQMEQDRKDWSEFFNQAGIFFDEMRNGLVKRIKKT